MKRILEAFKEIKVISITEMNQDSEKPIELRSIYDHFYSLSREELFKKDTQETTVEFQKKPAEKDEDS